MLSDKTATLEEVAAAIGKDPAWLERHWLSFHRRTGFPRRIPGTWVWPRQAVEFWLSSGGEGGGRPDIVSAANQNEAADPVALAAAALRERYGAN